MIKLFQYAPSWRLPNASPFCMKVETFLKMAQLPYETVTLPDPRKSPKGKLPYIQDDGEIISDSSLIIGYLTQKHDLKIDEELTHLQQGLSLSLQRLMEEHLYWTIVYSRWIEPAGWERVKASYFGSLPKALRSIIPTIVRRTVKKALFGQGVGRHSRNEIYNFAMQDLAVLKTQLEHNTYLISSDQPTSIDATGYAFIANILKVPITSPAQDYMRQHECFERYCSKMHKLFFSDAACCV